jgi:hypothetical protein
MLAKIVAWLLVVLCAIPTTAPFAVPSLLFGGGHAVGGFILQDTAASSVADDAVPLERSTFLSESRDCACAAASYVVVSTVARSFLQQARRAASVCSPPTIALVLRV